MGELRLNVAMPRNKQSNIPPQAPAIPKPFVESDASKLLQPASKWVSLLICVRTYKAKVLATAVENHGIFVIDRYNRCVPASPGPSSDLFSKSYALDLIALVAEEERDPGPIPSLDHERWEFEQHPLQRFGWPMGSLPDLDAIKNSGTVNVAVEVMWTQRTKAEFEDEKKNAGSFKAAGAIHKVTRQRYKLIYDRQTGAVQKKHKTGPATGLPVWGQLGARKK